MVTEIVRMSNIKKKFKTPRAQDSNKQGYSASSQLQANSVVIGAISANREGK